MNTPVSLPDSAAVDASSAENRLETERVPVEEFARFAGFWFKLFFWRGPI